VHQPPLDRHVRGGAKRCLEAADEGGGNRIAATVDPLADVSEGPVDVVSPEVRQPYRSEFRLEVPVNRHAVEANARRAKVHPSDEPLVEELADREPRALDMDAAIQPGQRLRQGLAGLPFRRETALLDPTVEWH
jgi:hypothetical protein